MQHINYNTPHGHYPSFVPYHYSPKTQKQPYHPTSQEPILTPRVLLLAPAVFGSWAAIVLSTVRKKNSLLNSNEPFKTMVFINLYTAGASIGIALYIYEKIRNLKDGPIVVFLPITLAISSAVFLYASMFNLAYQLFPSSFSGDIGNNRITQYVSFLYLSMTNISVGGLGDVLPKSIGTRFLVSMEALFNLFIIALGVALFARNR